MTTTTRTPQTLDELYEVLRASIHVEDREAYARAHGLPVAGGEIDWTSLPTFGGEEPRDTSGIWSWDERRLLVGTCPDDLEIIAREEHRTARHTTTEAIMAQHTATPWYHAHVSTHERDTFSETDVFELAFTRRYVRVVEQRIDEIRNDLNTLRAEYETLVRKHGGPLQFSVYTLPEPDGQRCAELSMRIKLLEAEIQSLDAILVQAERDRMDAEERVGTVITGGEGD